MTKRNFKVVIPARLESARFPGKVLTKINNKSMIQHVYERSCESDAADVIIATDDKAVVAECKSFGADVELTERYHGSGTDRIREVAENRKWDPDTQIVNVQGDSPLISPVSINQVASILELHGDVMSTLASRINTPEDFYNHNIVKVIWDAAGRAMYFSRAPIPYQEKTNTIWAWRHLGIYGYTLNVLRQITNCGPTQLENYERLEQLRVLEMGIPIKIQIARDPHGSDVDVPADVEVVENIMDKDVSDR